MASTDYDAEKANFIAYYQDHHMGMEKALVAFKSLITSLLETNEDIFFSDVVGRVKKADECLSKFSRKYRAGLEASGEPYSIKDKISDLLGIRIICLYEDDIGKIQKVIEGEFDVRGVTDKSAEMARSEDAFGYKGLHMDLALCETRAAMAEYSRYAPHVFELQIRTVAQDSWSTIDHKIKYKKSVPNFLKRRINVLAALFDLVDREFCAIRDATNALARDEGSFEDIEAEERANPPGTEGSGAATLPQMQAVGQGSTGGTAADGGTPRQGPTLLTPFGFLRIANHFFPRHEFEAHKVDGFTQEIMTMQPRLSRGKFNYYLRENLPEIRAYQQAFEAEHAPRSMNPYTVIRHCLYAGSPEIFSALLTEEARNRFDGWRKAKRHEQPH